MAADAIAAHGVPHEEKPLDSRETACCIVGGGPAGMILALLLARQGVDVTLLEAHKDFDRDFRGDTVHPSVLEILDQIGLAEPLLQLRHAKVYGPTFRTGDKDFDLIDLRHLKTRFPYIMLIPQVRFLEFLAAAARRYPNFHLIMSAAVTSLIEENGSVCGVRYQSPDGLHEVRAQLTVGADGRFSKVRQLAGIEPVKTSPPMDVLWFRLPHLPQESLPSGSVTFAMGSGRMLVRFDRGDCWQVGYVFPKGQYQQLRAQGLEAFRDSIVGIDSRFCEHVDTLTDWHQCSLLSVESNCCPCWYRPGLLLIGDAAHAMSPVGGVGINYAIADAVVAANLLAVPLKSGRVTVADLARVQKQREFPTNVIQRAQSFVQKRIIATAFHSGKAARIPWFARLILRTPGLRNIPARVLGFGIRPAHVEN